MDFKHIVFLLITLILMGIAFGLIYGLKPSFKTVFTVACVLCVISEVTKTLSCIEFDWIETYNASGEVIRKELVPFISMAHVPLHLCSIQILFIFLVRFLKPSNARTVLVAFMFPTFIIGAILALALPSNLSFTNPQSYQYFFYHGMLIVLGVYIMTQKEIIIQPKHYFTTLAILGALAFASIYTNSMLAHYDYDIVTGSFDLQYITKFFFIMQSPLPNVFVFTEKWHWYLYIVVIVLIAFIFIGLLYLPVFIKALIRKINNKKQSN